MDVMLAALDPRYRRFIKTQDRQSSVVCVKCGSARIDQNSLIELRCYDCENAIPWDGSKFTINRQNKDHLDILTAFTYFPAK